MDEENNELTCWDCEHTFNWKGMSACSEGQWIADHEECPDWKCEYFKLYKEN